MEQDPVDSIRVHAVRAREDAYLEQKLREHDQHEQPHAQTESDAAGGAERAANDNDNDPLENALKPFHPDDMDMETQPLTFHTTLATCSNRC